MNAARALLLATLSLHAGCVRGGSRAADGKLARADACHYQVRQVGSRPLLIDVQVRCSGREHTNFVASEPASARHFSRVMDDRGRALARQGAAFLLPEPSAEVGISYRLDLDAVARDAQSFDVALRSGDTVVATTSTWLLRPEPHAGSTAVSVQVTPMPGQQFVSGLTERGGAYHLSVQEIPVATYSLFGHVQTRDLDVGRAQHGEAPAQVRLAVADGPAAPVPVLERWVGDSAREVAKFWDGFPTNQALVAIVPVARRRGVVFGKVLPESSPGIVILLGEHTERDALYQDWVLIHELFHLGFPSFQGEAKWLDEGLATYYEPLIRARAGWKSEEDVWSEFVHAMPQGLDALAEGGLENATEYRQIYWGGAIVSLLADVAARTRSNGRLGLEDGLRRVLQRGGNASEVWSLARVTEVVDAAFDVPVLAPLVDAHAQRGTPVDLGALWKRLGVIPTTRGVRLTNHAPLATVRHAIVFGAPAPEPAVRTRTALIAAER